MRRKLAGTLAVDAGWSDRGVFALAMPLIELSTFVAAPIERVFDLARSIDLHLQSAARSREQAIGGVTSGLIGLHEQVTWRAKHFGIWQTLTVRITEFKFPTHFTDTMVSGAFREMEHHHDFEAAENGTLMRDRFRYCSPLGVLGRLADWLLLESYLRDFLTERNRVLKGIADGNLALNLP